MQAARVAARIRSDLHEEVRLVNGHYGEFKVLVDGEVVVDPGLLAAVGVLPTTRRILEAVRARLSASRT